jgi:putative ABC transport system permease protein
VRLGSSHLRSEPLRTSALIGGIAAAAAAFTVLCMNATALTVEITGRVPAASPRRAYDILVRVPSRIKQQSGAGSLSRPTDLAELSGGITLAQYDTISHLPGVQVAAPMTMVGYVPLTVVIPVPVPASAVTSAPALFAATAEQRSEGGLSTVTELNVGSTYVTSDPLSYSSGGAGLGSGDVAHAADGTQALVCPRAEPSPLPPVFSADARRRTACWSSTTGPAPDAWTGSPPATVSVPVAWTFLLPLVAVDPAAEARLLHLNRAVTQGSYLPDTAVTHSGPVPVIIASSIDDDSLDSLSVSRLPASDASSYAAGLTPSQINALLDSARGQTVATRTVTAAQAYGALLSYLHAARTATVAAYWSTTAARYTIGPDGALTPQPVPTNAGVWALPYALTGQDAAADGATGTGFRALVPHVARSFADGAVQSSAASLRAVGVFDPAAIANSPATPSPYQGEQLAGATVASRRLLGGGTLDPDGNPAGYPSPGATLVMPLQDIGAFTAASAYTGTDGTAPIGSIRVRVAGGSGDDALSQERVRTVAQEIVRATGLSVDVTLAASAASRTIDLAASRDGRPALVLSEVWYRSATQTIVSTAVDPRTIALSASVLLVGSVFVVNASMATLQRRRRELVTLRALGWRRRRVVGQLVQEFAVISVTAGLLAVLASCALQAVISRQPVTWWPLLSMPAAMAMTFVAAWWHVRRATAGPVPIKDLAALGQAGGRWPLGGLQHAMRSLRRAPLHSALSVLVIAIAGTALGALLAVRWMFGGVIVGSWFGAPIAWQASSVDVAAVITLLVLATITMTDISWLTCAERAPELRTLRAIGWSALSVARLAAGEAVLPGLAGGAIASVLNVLAIGAVVHRVPLGLIPVVATVMGAGALISLTASGLSAAAEHAAKALG